MMNLDQLALKTLINRGPNMERDLAALSAKLTKAVRVVTHNECECPDCGHVGPHEDNGLPTGDGRELLCMQCDCRWEI